MWVFNRPKKMPKPKRAKPLRRKRIADNDIEEREETLTVSSVEFEERREFDEPED